jgi:uncharacterized RDD family membrane protein YckC
MRHNRAVAARRGAAVSTNNPYAPPRGAVRDVADSAESAEPAERVTRLVAAILDGIVFVVMVYVPVLIVMAGSGGFADPAVAGEPNIVVIGLGSILVLIGLIAWIWLTVVNVARNGQTIAKKMLGIKVVRTDGSKASLGRIFWLRNVVNGLLGIIPLYGLIDILFIFGAPRQCIHDKLADTIVIKA